MTLETLKITDFRCLEAVEVELDQRYNLIFGANASGKTSLLEAIAYLGRGRSFRGANTNEVIRHGSTEFLLQGKVMVAGRSIPIGIRNSRKGPELRVAGENVYSAAALAEAAL